MKATSILDIGSSKVVCLVGSFAARGATMVHGAGVAAYSGYAEGAFFDEADLENAIVSAVREAEEMACMRIREIAVSVPAPFSKLLVTGAGMRLSGERPRFSRDDLDTLINRSLENTRTPEYVIMHSTPVSFTVDGAEIAGSPEGVAAGEVEAKISHMFVRLSYVDLIKRILQGLSIEIPMFVSTPLAVSALLIAEQERLRPSVLLDVGYTHSDITLAENGAIINMASIDMGGAQFASDLAFGLDIPLEYAEQVKRRYSFLQDEEDDIETIHMPTGVKRVRRDVIDLIVEARAEEFSELVLRTLEQLGIRQETRPVSYLTGGGFSMMRGGGEYLRQMLGIRVKRDMPYIPGMDSPNYASAFGVLNFVLDLGRDESDPGERADGKQNIVQKLNNIFHRVKG